MLKTMIRCSARHIVLQRSLAPFSVPGELSVLNALAPEDDDEPPVRHPVCVRWVFEMHIRNQWLPVMSRLIELLWLVESMTGNQ